jgi:membrane protease YdiL (CAAX protease family)
VRSFLAGVIILGGVALFAEEFVRRRGMGTLNGLIAFGFAGAGGGAVAGAMHGGAEAMLVGSFVGLVIGAAGGLMLGILWRAGRQAMEPIESHGDGSDWPDG